MKLRGPRAGAGDRPRQHLRSLGCCQRRQTSEAVQEPVGAGAVLQRDGEDLSQEEGQGEWAGEAFVEDCVWVAGIAL